MRGDRLRDAREARHLSQKELADMINISDQQVYRYEAGRSDPTSEVLLRLAKTLEVSTDYLVGLVNEPTAHLSETPLGPVEKNLISAYRRGDFREAMRILSETPATALHK